MPIVDTIHLTHFHTAGVAGFMARVWAAYAASILAQQWMNEQQRKRDDDRANHPPTPGP